MTSGGHWLTLLFVFLMSSASVAAPQQAKYSVKEHRAYNLAVTQIEKLHAEVDGADYVIDHEAWAKYLCMEVFETFGMDRDGYQDALVSQHTGGNCCATDCAVVSHRGGSFFTVYADQMVASWSPPRILALGGEIWLEFLTISAGAENTTMDEILEQYALRDGQLRRVRRLKNDAMLFATRQTAAADLVAQGIDSGELVVDLDGDGTDDAIICEYWGRWGSLKCLLQSSQHPGNIWLPHDCKRVGILEARTNGLLDLACGRNGQLIFNGVNYVEGLKAMPVSDGILKLKPQ